MEENKRNKRIQKCYNILRALIITVFLGSLLLWAVTAEAADNREWIPEIHGTVRGKLEYLLKRYYPNQYAPVHAADAFLTYTHAAGKLGLSYLMRYDYMSQQELTDAERHRLTAGITLHLFPEQRFQTDLRLNYEKYFYAAVEGEQPKRYL